MAMPLTCADVHTAAQLLAACDARPEDVKEYARGLRDQARRDFRRRLQGLGPAYEGRAAEFVPLLKAAGAFGECDPFAGLTWATRLKPWPSCAAEWTAEKASAQANAALASSENPHSQAHGLGALRRGLRSLGVAPEVVAATFRPLVTIAHNSASAEAAKTPRAIPAGLFTAEGVKREAEAFVGGSPPNVDTLAALIVALCARRGEIEGPDGLRLVGGRIVGALKKRAGVGAEREFNVVSCLCPDLARAFLSKWRALPEDVRGSIEGKTLTKYCARKRITAPDLRAIGAQLVVDAAQAKSAKALSARETNRLRAEALRHAARGLLAVEHYDRVEQAPAASGRDVAALEARIRELEARLAAK